MEQHVRRIGTVVEQATVVFEGAEITAVRADDGFIYGSLSHLCKALGLDGDSQRETIENHAVMVEGLLQFPLIRGTRIVDTWCLRTNLIAMWLTIVSVRRLKPEKQERIYEYQRKAADVLDRLFGVGSESTGSVLQVSEPAYAEGLAIARLASEQAERALQKAEIVDERTIAMETRLMALEARLLPREQISEEQAEIISDLVKQAAIALGQKLGGNYFGTIYGQLYRMFKITSYKSLTIAQYPKAIAWLEKMIQDNRKE